MKHLKSTLFLIFGIVGFSNISKANLKSNDNLLVKGHNLASQCQQLMYLENKENLTFEEETEGRLLHDIIAQIADTPLEYCEIAGMRDGWQDTGTEEIISSL